MATKATIDALMASAVSAAAGGNYQTAIDYAIQARAYLAVMPQSSRAAPGGGNQSLAWNNVGQIDAVIADWRRAIARTTHAAAGPFVAVPITYRRETDDADYT